MDNAATWVTGGVVALATIAVAVATIVLALKTNRYVDLTRKLVDLQLQPNLSISPGLGRAGHSHHTVLRVVNHGGGSALNLNITCQRAFDENIILLCQFLREGQPISCLGPGRDLDILVEQVTGAYQTLPPLMVTVAYQDLQGSDYAVEFPVNFRTLNYVDKF